MALTVASTREKVIMIEAGANEVPEAQDDRSDLCCSRSKPEDYRIY